MRDTKTQRLRKILRHNGVALFRFGIVGASATLLHLSVTTLLLKLTSLKPIAANTLGFLTAFGLSFVGNHKWSFSGRARVGYALPRFFVTSLSAFLLNTVCLAALLKRTNLSPIVAVVAASVVIPLATFLLARLWVFRNAEHSRISD